MRQTSHEIEMKNKIKVECECCGCVVRKDFLPRHKKTDKCKNYHLKFNISVQTYDIEIKILENQIAQLKEKRQDAINNYRLTMGGPA